MKYDTSYWDFIAKYHPRYSSDDNVLICDILFRYLSGDEVSREDLIWIGKDFRTREEVLHELKRLETILFTETLSYYYDQIGLST